MARATATLADVSGFVTHRSLLLRSWLSWEFQLPDLGFYYIILLHIRNPSFLSGKFPLGLGKTEH